GLSRAEKAGIPSFVVEHRKYPDRRSFEEEMITILGQYRIDLVVLAGFMRILSPFFIETFNNRIINIHPSLLPSFPGINAQKQAWDHGVKIAGTTVHFVDSGVDTGPIILQAPVSIDHTVDSAEKLKSRILEKEHVILPEAVKLFCEDRLVIRGRRVEILQESKV
ncbi:MAG: phosphoribosylglycinamide formyltransferase, partial [Candidatus Hodarchaeales archaeon]